MAFMLMIAGFISGVVGMFTSNDPITGLCATCGTLLCLLGIILLSLEGKKTKR